MKLTNQMDVRIERAVVIFSGIIGGTFRSLQLHVMPNITSMTLLIEPLVNAAMYGAAALLGKDMYKWAKGGYTNYFLPWYRKFKNRKK